MLNPIKKQCFVHIPKCSGTAFEGYLVNCGTLIDKHACYTGIGPDGSIETFNNFIKRCANKHLLYGHVAYRDFIQLFPDAAYMVFLRDPIKRTISQFKSWHNPSNWNVDDPHYQTSDQELRDAIKFAQKATLKEFITTNNQIILNNALCNVQTSMLSLSGNNWSERLTSAKTSLNKFTFIGLTEDFKQSINLYRAIFNINEEYDRFNIYERRSNIDIGCVDQQTIEKISDLVAYDVQLYEHAKVLYSDLKLKYRIK